MKIFGKVKGHDFWVSLSSGKTQEQYEAFSKTKHKWDQLHYGDLPEGQQTIGQKLGYIS